MLSSSCTCVDKNKILEKRQHQLCINEMSAFLFVLLNIILNVRSSNNNGADQKRFDGFQENQKCYTNVGENLSSVINMFSRL